MPRLPRSVLMSLYSKERPEWLAEALNDIVRADRMFYVRHQSFGLDARIVVKTFKAIARGK